MSGSAGVVNERLSSRCVHMWRRLSQLVTRLAAVAWLVGILLWVTVQDRVPYVSAVFYALPLPVLILAGTIVCCVSVRRKHDSRIVVACLLVLTVQILLWSDQAFRAAASGPPEGSHRLLFWNVCRGSFGFDAVARELAQSDADVIALVEATEEAQSAEFWTSRIPGYSAVRLGSGMMILCRGEILDVVPDHVTVPAEPEAVCRYRIISIRIDGKRFRLLLMDVKSHPLMVRRPAFVRLRELAEKFADEPLIVAADFNTPIDSVWIDALRPWLANSFEVAGEGYRETWPTLFPVLCLDQVWGNKLVTWHRCRHGWSLRSDHRSITTEFSLNP